MIKEFEIPNSILPEVLGKGDEKIKALAESLKVDVKVKGNKGIIEGETEDKLKLFLDTLEKIIEKVKAGADLSVEDYRHFSQRFLNKENGISEGIYYELFKTYTGKRIVCKTRGQYNYIKAMENNRLVICSGPAGTGKTFLAIVQAIRLLKSGKVERIILVKPALEAGESLGYLPGTYIEKLDPYFKPLYDALFYLLGVEKIERLISSGVIEIVPLAYMRGRTLNSSFIILDEGQNTTFSQMKMFLTRIGMDSYTVVTGDLSQVDLDRPANSGLKILPQVLKGVPQIEFIKLNNQDIVRDDLVQKIIMAYEKFEVKHKKMKEDL